MLVSTVGNRWVIFLLSWGYRWVTARPLSQYHRVTCGYRGVMDGPPLGYHGVTVRLPLDSTMGEKKVTDVGRFIFAL